MLLYTVKAEQIYYYINSMVKQIHAKYAAILLAILSFIANIAAITGLVTSKFTEIVITAALIVAIYGAYLFLQRWGRPLGWMTTLAAIITIAGSVMLSLSLQSYYAKQSQDAQNTHAVTTPDNQTAQPIGRGGTDVKPDSPHTRVFTKQFLLKPYDGLELDDEKGTIYSQQTSAQAPIDIFVNSNATYISGFSDFYSYQPLGTVTGNNDKDEYNACVALTTESQMGDSNIYSYSLQPDAKYCTKTNRGRIALVTIKEVISQSSGASQNGADIIVKLWN